MRRLVSRCIRDGLLLSVALGLPAAGITDPLTVTRWTVDGGGVGRTMSGQYALGATIGQPDAGLLIAGPYSLRGGFWGGPGGGVVAVGDDGPGDPHRGPGPRPLELRIYPAMPNPAPDRTVIAFDLPDARDVEVRIFDVRGAQVRVLGAGKMPAGHHAIQWNGTDAGGRHVAAGLYIVRVRLGEITRSQKLVVTH